MSRPTETLPRTGHAIGSDSGREASEHLKGRILQTLADVDTGGVAWEPCHGCVHGPPCAGAAYRPCVNCRRLSRIDYYKQAAKEEKTA
jgi:hypothetical protein